MDSAARWHISVMTTSMSSVPIDQTLHDDGSRVKAWLSGVDWSSPPNTELASVILLPMGVRPTSRTRGGHSTSIIAIDPVIILLIIPVLIMSVTMSFTPRGRSGAMS